MSTAQDHAEGHEERMTSVGKYASQRERIYTALAVVGNGDAVKGEEILFKLAQRLEHARKKHNHMEWKGLELRRAIVKLQDEVEEQKYAATDETHERVIDEGYDVLAVEIRIINGEHKRVTFRDDKGRVL